MMINEPATWCLYDAAAVGGSVVRCALAEGDTLGHYRRGELDCALLRLILSCG